MGHMKRYCFGLALFLPLALTLPLLWAQAPGQKYAILVGINNYEHEKLPSLKYAEADASELEEVLKSADYRVTLLTGSSKEEDNKPTKANIEKKLRSVVRGCRKGDTLIVAFAGHGLQFVGQKDCYFCPQDARPFPTRTDSLVSLNGVYQEIDESFAGMKVLLVDACRDDPNTDRGARGVNADTAPRPPQGVAALFSCRAGERAYENDKLRHGLFFYHVLQGLKGDAADRDKEVTFAGLAAYVSRRVARDVSTLIGADFRQSPNLKADYSTEPVLLVVKDTGTPIRPAKTEPKMPAQDSSSGDGFPVFELVREVDLGKGVKMEFVDIKAGAFSMGSLDSDSKANPYEKPQHEVKITRDFHLGRFPVTQEQYEAVTGKNPSYYSATGFNSGLVTGLDTRRFPVEHVSWDEAKAFCDQLSKQDPQSRKFSLPTEAQWEYACRAGTSTRYFFGDDPAKLDAHAWYAKNSRERPHQVGSKKPNAWGLYDMQGNVWQHCADWYDEKYYDNSPKEDPPGPDKGEARVLRGGCWKDGAEDCRAAARDRTETSATAIDAGFRVLMHKD